MDFVLVVFIALAVLLLVLLFFIFRIFYKRSGNKLEINTYEGKTILDDAHEIVDNYERAVEEREKHYG